MADEKRSDPFDPTCPFCGKHDVTGLRYDMQTRHVERNMSLDNVNRLLAGEPMVPEENVHVEGRVRTGTTLTVKHEDGRACVGTPPSERKQ